MTAKRILCIACLSFITLFAFSLEQDVRTDSNRSSAVISPVPGTWSNYQSLILDLPKNAVAFYSFTGDDPLFSGFAYDGPVLIEKDGPVLLRIVTVLSDNTSIEQKVEYTVNLQYSDEQFYQRALKRPYVSLTSASPLSLPSTVRYCIGDGIVPYLSGRTLSLEVPNAIDRYVPLIIQDFSNCYRLMLRLESEREASGFTKETQASFPFTITCSNWTDFTISGAESILFSLDGSPWSGGEGTVQLDRSIDHVVVWKYESETDDRSRSFVLPSKPVLLVDQAKGASPLNLSISNPAFTFKKPSDTNALASRSWSVDSVFGEHLSSVVSVEVYFMGIRQGLLSKAISVDKQPPQKPVFTSSSSTFYARDAVTVQIKSDEQIYYAVAEPKISDFGFSDLEVYLFQDSTDKVNKEYTLYNKSSFLLSENRGGAVLYTLHAYAQDKAGNVSENESFSVVVDSYNYYVNSLPAADYESDGSPARPFTAIEDVLSVLNQKDYVRLHITGIFTDVPSLEFTKDCDILGVGTSHIQFAPNSTVLVKNADVAISGCVLEQQNTSSINSSDDSIYQRSFFFVQDGTLYLDNADIIYSGYRNASFIQANNSTVRLKESAITIQAQSYASGITSVGSIIGFISSRISVIAPTSAAFSASKGTLIVDSSSVALMGELARVAEVSSSMYYLINNTFTLSPPSSVKTSSGLPKKTIEPLWADYSSIQKAYINNTLTGF